MELRMAGPGLDLAAALPPITMVALAACQFASCDGAGGRIGGSGDGSSLAEAGFRKAVETREPETPEDAQEDQILPPEVLWSPHGLAAGKTGRGKGCFPRTEKDYAMVLARAGQIEIPVSDFTAVFHPYTLDATKLDEDSLEIRRSIVWDLLDVELLSLVAMQKGYESAQTVELLRKRELAEKVRKDLKAQASKEIGEGAYKTYYKLHPEKYRIHPDQRRVARILVHGKKAAVGIIKDLGPGTVSVPEFAKKAREVSIEPDAKKTGGLTGWFDREGMDSGSRIVPEKLAVLAFAMKKGDVHDQPFATSAGSTVFQLVAIRDEAWIPYSKVRSAIVGMFVSERTKVLEANLLESLRKNHPVSFNMQLLEKISPVPCL